MYKNQKIKGGGGGDTLDFEVLQHLSEEGGITQQLYIRVYISERSLNFLSKNVNFMSVGSVALILSELSCPRVVATHLSSLHYLHFTSLSSPISMGLYVSNLIHGVLNDVELELVFNLFIYLAPLLISYGLNSNKPKSRFLYTGFYCI